MFKKQAKGATEKRKSSGGLSSLLWMLFGAILTMMLFVFLYLSPLVNFNPSSKSGSNTTDQDQTVEVTESQDPDYEFYDILPEQEMVTIPTASVVDEQKEVAAPVAKADVTVTPTTKNRPQPVDNNKATYGISEETILNPEKLNPEENTSTGAATTNAEATIEIVEEEGTYDEVKPAATAQKAEQLKADGTTYILQINSYDNADNADARRAEVLMAGVEAKVIKRKNADGQTIYQVISRPMDSKNAGIARQRLQNSGIDSIVVKQGG